MKFFFTKLGIIIILAVCVGGWFFARGKDTAGDWGFLKKFNLASIPAAEVSMNNVYTNSKYNFSFEYPDGLKISEFKEGDFGDTILAQGDGKWFQIFISEFDEADPITPERIKWDLPSMAVEESQQVIITENKITGLIFFSEENSLGRTREVWFTHSGYLYQITTEAEMDNFIGEILEKWQFE